jgi:thioredoxin reductase (NADPH)
VSYTLVKCSTNMEVIVVPFFVVVSGELEIMRPFGAAETLVTVFGPGQFTGEVNTISGRRTFFRARASKRGKVIELDHPHMLALMQTDAELGDITMRAFILRRVEFSSNTRTNES